MIGYMRHMAFQDARVYGLRAVWFNAKFLLAKDIANKLIGPCRLTSKPKWRRG